MITYDQLAKIFREQLKILFPDKHIASNEAKSNNMECYEMQFHIVVDPEKPHLIIGFTKKAGSSMIDIWNGKRMNRVIDVDIDDGFIRRYHEPRLYAESSDCLGYSQVSAIYTALDTVLNCEDAVDERYVKYDPAISLEQIQTVIERWMKSNNIRGNACESEAGRFYYDLYDGKFINGSVITSGDEKEILIWMNTDAPVMRITPSVASLMQTHVPSFTDKEVCDLYNEISEAAVLLEETKKKHPLQDSPTFPEECSAEEIIHVNTIQPLIQRGEIINMKHVKEKISYEFDINSFEKNQAYKITLPSIGLRESEFIGILDHVDSSIISFIITKYEERPEIQGIGNTSISNLTIDINDYIKGNISIIKLGVVGDE